MFWAFVLLKNTALIWKCNIIIRFKNNQYMCPFSAHNCSSTRDIFSCYESIVLEEDIIISDDDDNGSEPEKETAKNNR